jgi:hypothetical protein
MAILLSILVTPVGLSLPVGVAQQYAATGVYADQPPQDITTQATWSSSAPAVATVGNQAGNKGRVTGQSMGVANVRATLSGVTGLTPVTVVAPVVANIRVTPGGPIIEVGETLQLAAVATLTNLTTVDVTQAARWGSTDESVATVGARGLMVGVALGTCQVGCALQGVTGGVNVRVALSRRDVLRLLKQGKRVYRETWPAERYAIWSFPDVLSIARPLPTAAQVLAMTLDEVRTVLLPGLQVSDGYELTNQDLLARDWLERTEPGRIG